jgi:hypothetical protein
VSNNIEIKSGTVISVTVPEQSPSNVTIAGMKSVGITDSRYEHTQETVGKVWEINHNLNKKPSVTVVDSGDNVVIGEVQYVDNNNLTVSFNASFSGKAYLN